MSPWSINVCNILFYISSKIIILNIIYIHILLMQHSREYLIYNSLSYILCLVCKKETFKSILL